MFRKQYNNNLLFIALIVILLAVIAAFAYLIMKANSGKQEPSNTNPVQNSLEENSADIIIDDTELPDNQKEVESSASVGTANADPEIIINDTELPDDQKEVASPTDASADAVNFDPEIIINDTELPDDQK